MCNGQKLFIKSRVNFDYFDIGRKMNYPCFIDLVYIRDMMSIIAYQERLTIRLRYRNIKGFHIEALVAIQLL